MKKPRSGINLHRPLRPGALKQRFRRIRAAIPSAQDADTESYKPWGSETDEYWDPWDHPWYPGGIREYWKIRKTWDELVGVVSIAERVPNLDWSRVSVVGPRQTRRGIPAVPHPWPTDDLPRALHNSLAELARTDRVCLSLNSDVTKMDLSPFRRIAENCERNDLRASVMGGMAAGLYLSPFWVRAPADFVLIGDDLRQTIQDLMEHLFTVYPVSPCLRNAWFTRCDNELPDTRWIAWYVLSGQGASIQRAGSLFGWHASPSLLHHLPAAPGDLIPTDGFIWADIKRLGGDQIEFLRLRAQAEYAYSPLGLEYHPPRFKRFVEDTVRWLVKHRRTLTDEMCRLILPWAAYLYRTQNFSWKGRSPARAHRLAVEYAEDIQRPYPNVRWKKKGWDWEWTTKQDGIWSVHELVSGKDLYEEGKAMSHCVSSYTMHCYQGRSAICSLRCAGSRRLTFEVDPESLSLGQARGPHNRTPTPEEIVRLQEWQTRMLQVWKSERTDRAIY